MLRINAENKQIKRVITKEKGRALRWHTFRGKKEWVYLILSLPQVALEKCERCALIIHGTAAPPFCTWLLQKERLAGCFPKAWTQKAAVKARAGQRLTGESRGDWTCLWSSSQAPSGYHCHQHTQKERIWAKSGHICANSIMGHNKSNQEILAVSQMRWINK